MLRKRRPAGETTDPTRGRGALKLADILAGRRAARKMERGTLARAVRDVLAKKIPRDAKEPHAVATEQVKRAGYPQLVTLAHSVGRDEVTQELKEQISEMPSGRKPDRYAKEWLERSR